MKIYTKKGDSGNTQLFGGTSVPKHHLRVGCYGGIDELNANIGLLLAESIDDPSINFLHHLQILLFDIGSHLATDPSKEKAKENLPAIEEQELKKIEEEIDQMQEELNLLKHFILPRGNHAIAQAHVCRTICRRVERMISQLTEIEEVEEHILPIINRLSDYFFVLARHIARQNNIEEVKWEPRK